MANQQLIRLQHVSHFTEIITKNASLTVWNLYDTNKYQFQSGEWIKSEHNSHSL